MQMYVLANGSSPSKHPRFLLGGDHPAEEIMGELLLCSQKYRQ